MSVSDIITRGRIREDRLWSPFGQDPFGGNKVELFGLYANTYLHGYAYLEDISGEKLIQIVTEFDSNMAQLDAQQQAVVIENTTKRYIDTIEQQIHDQKMNTRRAEIDAQDSEYDAKFDALEKDRLAILTKREQLAQDIQKAQADIQILEARIEEESLNQKYVAVDIAEKELEAAQKKLQVLEAGIRGVELQYEIANTAVEKADLNLDIQQTQQRVDLVPGELKEIQAASKGADADIIRTNANFDMVDVEIAKTELDTVKTQLSAESRDVDTDLLEVDIAKAELDTTMVDVQITETEAKTAKEEVRQAELQNDIAMVGVKLAQIQLDIDRVTVQLKEIEADIVELDAKKLRENLAGIEQEIAFVKKDNLSYEISEKKDARIDAIEKQITVLEERITAEEAYQDLEDIEHDSRMDKQQLEHDYRTTITELDNELSIHRAQVKIDSYAKELQVESEADEAQVDEDAERVKIQASQIEAAKIAGRAAEDAAETMAKADIINTLTHEIGST